MSCAQPTRSYLEASPAHSIRAANAHRTCSAAFREPHRDSIPGLNPTGGIKSVTYSQELPGISANATETAQTCAKHKAARKSKKMFSHDTSGSV